MECPLRLAIVRLITAFEAKAIDFDQFMLQLAAVMGSESTSERARESVMRAWNSLDDSYAIACSQTWSRPIQLELNDDVRAEYENFRRTVQNPVIH